MFVSQVAKAFLLMQTERIVNRRSDFARAQVLSQFVALLDPNHILVINVIIRCACIPKWFDWQSPKTPEGDVSVAKS